MADYSIHQLRAELERRGCRPHPNPLSVVVPIGEMWFHPDGVTRIVIPRPVDGMISRAVVEHMLAYYDIPESKPGN